MIFDQQVKSKVQRLTAQMSTDDGRSRQTVRVTGSRAGLILNWPRLRQPGPTSRPA